jgi:hypothetical protein
MVRWIAIAAACAAMAAAPAAAECEWRGYPRAKLLVDNNTTVPVSVYTTEAAVGYYEQRTAPAVARSTLENFLLVGRNRVLVAVTVDGVRHERSYGDIVVNNVGAATCDRVFTVTIFARDFAGVIFPRDPPAPRARGTFLACYGDNRGAAPTGTTGRDLDGYAFSSATMTVQACIDACASRGFTHAGVQFRSWCFCGNSPGRYPSTVASCNMPCAGDARQTCGGEWANSVYRIDR